MKRSSIVLGALAAAFLIPNVAASQMMGPRPFVGVDVGVSVPTNDNYWAHVHEGGAISPYFGYMFDEAFGVQANLHAVVQSPDDDDRGFSGEEDLTTVLGATFGPRLSIPFNEKFEPYLVGQGGVFGGVSGRLDDEFDAGVSLGGGIDYYVSTRWAISAFGRWQYSFLKPTPRDLNNIPGATNPNPQDLEDSIADDAQWVTAGIGIKYDWKPLPKPRKAPPPAAKKPEPAPVLPPPTKKKIVLRGVQFDFDKANIRDDAKPILDEAARTLAGEKAVTVVVAGHTDAVGSDAYNMRLSERRAKSVKGYLIGQGIDADRMSVRAFGESMPVADNETEEGRAQNRRVELEVQD
mgnify:FL=1